MTINNDFGHDELHNSPTQKQVRNSILFASEKNE